MMKSLYLCDPVKNSKCKKTSCYGCGTGPCFATTNEELAVTITDGRAIKLDITMKPYIEPILEEVDHV